MNPPRVLALTLLLPLFGGCGSSEIAADRSTKSTQTEIAKSVSEDVSSEGKQYGEAQEACVYLNNLIDEHAAHDEAKVKFWVYSDGSLETKWVTKDITYRIQVTDVSLESIRVGKRNSADGYSQSADLSFEPKDSKVFKRSDSAFHNSDDDSKAHYLALSSVDAAERAKRALIDILTKAGAESDPYASPNGG